MVIENGNKTDIKKITKKFTATHLLYSVCCHNDHHRLNMACEKYYNISIQPHRHFGPVIGYGNINMGF